MALYIGSEKALLISNNFLSCLYMGNKENKKELLLSSDNYMLKDANGLYLIVKKGGN